MIDYHLHPNWTSDGKNSVEEMCEKALNLGLKEIAFVPHLIIKKFKEVKGWKEEWIRTSTLNKKTLRLYVKDVERVMSEFDLKILVGLEVDYFEGKENELKKILKEYEFDIILGSVHFLGNYSIASYESAVLFWKKHRNVYTVFEKYFKLLKKAIESNLFDVMAHPDVIRRFVGKVRFDKYKESIMKVVDSLKENGVGIEINTSGLMHPVKDIYPSENFLKICREWGINKITIGSDAHCVDDIYFGITKGLEIAKKIGIKKIALFRKRNYTLTKLDKLLKSKK